MDSVLDQIGEWLKELLVSGIMNQLTGLFDSVNTQVGNIATQVGTTPTNFSPGVFAMIRNVSESVIIPVAGLILTFIACYELIQMIIDHNNLANFEIWIFFKWVFKTFAAVTLITNTSVPAYVPGWHLPCQRQVLHQDHPVSGHQLSAGSAGGQDRDLRRVVLLPEFFRQLYPL